MQITTKRIEDITAVHRCKYDNTFNLDFLNPRGIKPFYEWEEDDTFGGIGAGECTAFYNNVASIRDNAAGTPGLQIWNLATNPATLAFTFSTATYGIGFKVFDIIYVDGHYLLACGVNGVYEAITLTGTWTQRSTEYCTALF